MHLKKKEKRIIFALSVAWFWGRIASKFESAVPLT